LTLSTLVTRIKTSTVYKKMQITAVSMVLQCLPICPS